MMRRNFIRSTSIALATAPLITASKVIEVAREKKKPIEPLKAGSLLTSEYMAEIVNRINNLEERV